METEKFIVEVNKETREIVSQPVPYVEKPATSLMPVKDISYLKMGLIGGGVLAFLILFFGAFVIVKQQTVKVIERFGKFKKVMRAGVNFKFPIIDSVVKHVDLRIQQSDITIETKTKDNVFVNMGIAVQSIVMPDKVFEAVYKLEDPSTQIKAYVYDVVRAKVPTLTLDELFEKKEEIALAVKEALTKSMDDFGFSIITALIVDIDPDKKVKDAMNNINAAARDRKAAEEKGEGDKVLSIKKAEGEAESKRLQGEGIAKQRKEIIMGLKESVKDLAEATGVSSEEVMNLVLLTQYFDAITEIGTKSGNSSIFLPGSPSGMKGFADEIRTAIISGNKVK